MTGAARIIGRVSTRMTLGAVAIRILMVDGEGMVERCIAPGICVVTVGTLPLEVIRRPCMARLAVCQPIMAEIHILKITRVLMAACASPWVMVAWWVMAGRAILAANIGVAEVRIAEIVGVLMAGRTRSGKMALRRVVAGRAILTANIGVTE